MANTPEYIETTVVSTRLRLARNLRAYPFPAKLQPRQAEDVIRLVGNALSELDDGFKEYRMGRIEKQEALLLQEQHLLSPALIEKGNGAAAFVSSDRHVSVMVNEEDHLREQYILKGFDLYKAFERVNGLDEGIACRLSFAYDEKLGFLTACPSNVGTGMRASVLMFLPGLEKTNRLQELLPSLKAAGLTVRGMFGEGTRAEGYSYQISNERTLGLKEKDILDQMVKVAVNVCGLEHRAREKLLRENRVKWLDECLRAYGTLTNCAVLPLKELAENMVKIQLGLALGFFRASSANDFNDFLADMRPASFRIENDLVNASEYECDLERAQIVGRVLPELVVRE